MAKAPPRFFRLGTRRIWRCLLLFAVAVMVVSGKPYPADAAPTQDQVCCYSMTPGLTRWVATKTTSLLQDAKDWLESFALVKAIIDGWNWVNEKISDFTKLINEKLGLATAVTHVSSALKAQQKYYANQSKNAVKIETPINALLAEEAAKTAPSTEAAAASNVMCNTVVAQQGQIVAHWFALSVEVALSAATKSIGLGRYADFSGPQFIGFIDKLRCPNKKNPDDPRRNDPPMENPINDPGRECRATHPDFVDADLSPPGEDDVLEMPPIFKVKGPDGKDINVPVPDDSMPYENYHAQQMFMAKWKYCIIKRGAFETPPVGKAGETPDGKTRAITEDSLAVLRDASTSLCFKQLARHTRPNCWNTDYNNVCAASRAACDAAKANGIPLPFGCDQALTLAQTEYIAEKVRLSSGQLAGYMSSAGVVNGGIPSSTGDLNRDYLATTAAVLRQIPSLIDQGDGPSAGERALILQAAEQFCGTPYSQYDCSHSVWKVYQNAGLPYSYSDTRSFAAAKGRPDFKPISWDNLQPGDVLLIDRGTDEKGHLMIYAGNNLIYSVGSSDARSPNHFYRLKALSRGEGPQAYRYIVKR